MTDIKSNNIKPPPQKNIFCVDITQVLKPYYLKYNDRFLNPLIELYIQWTTKWEEDTRSDIIKILQITNYKEIVKVVDRVAEIYQDEDRELYGYESLKEIMKPEDLRQLVKEIEK